jgi:hypothetical protein
MRRRLLVTVFENEEDIVGATTVAREQGLKIADAYTPYAVHGLDRAMGISPTRLPWVCFILGLLGAVSVVAFEYWASAVDWPINVGGKPWNSLPAFIPPAFEVMVLMAGIGTVLAFIFIAGLRPGRIGFVPDPRVTDDQFALVLVEAGSGFDRPALEALFSRFHPVKIEERLEGKS